MDEKKLLEAGYRKYVGKDIDVFFKEELCIHAQNCIHSSLDVFDVERRPWVLPDAAKPEEVMRAVNSCRVAALHYILHDTKEDDE
ncbi:MAG: (4Fe-4S)-binding protein [Lysinibacillus sp.]